MLLFEEKINSSLFYDSLVEEKEWNRISYKINKIADYYKPNQNIVNSFHNIRLFSNSFAHLSLLNIKKENNDLKIDQDVKARQDLNFLPSILDDINIVLSWISNLYINSKNYN